MNQSVLRNSLFSGPARFWDMVPLSFFCDANETIEGNKMVTGTVKWFNAQKGYGFIAVEGSDDVFVHISAVQESGIDLKEDMKVSFEKQQGSNGKYSAINLVNAI